MDGYNSGRLPRFGLTRLMAILCRDRDPVDSALLPGQLIKAPAGFCATMMMIIEGSFKTAGHAINLMDARVD